MQWFEAPLPLLSACSELPASRNCRFLTGQAQWREDLVFRVQKHVLGSPSLSQGRPPGEAVDRLLDCFFLPFRASYVLWMSIWINQPKTPFKECIFLLLWLKSGCLWYVLPCVSLKYFRVTKCTWRKQPGLARARAAVAIWSWWDGLESWVRGK